MVDCYFATSSHCRHCIMKRISVAHSLCIQVTELALPENKQGLLEI